MAAKKRSTKAAKKTNKRAAVASAPPAKAAKKPAARAAATKKVVKALPAKKVVKAPTAKKVVKAPAGKKAARRPATAALRVAQKPLEKASEADTTPKLQAGDRAPSFALPDQQGETVSSDSLAGQPYVLYFYPKDDTPGCTTEACGFRDAFPDFAATGVHVLGVSPDGIASHQKFVGKYGLPFKLLSDASRELASAYGVWALKKNYGREFMGIVRSTFLVDGAGVVRKVWRGVRVNGHVGDVQAAAAELAGV
jgi:thioredoxin-dependent peroxiredoxin